MKSKVLLPIFALHFLACGGAPKKGADSETASVAIGSFQPKPGDPDWKILKLEYKKEKEDAIRKEYDRSQFTSSKLNDVSIKILYGTYRFNLEYFDKTNNLVYEACSQEKAKDHVIQTAVYQTVIKICKKGTDAPVGEVTVKPSSEVKITPTLEEGGAIGKPAECQSNGKAMVGFDEVLGKCIDQKTSWYTQDGEIYRRGQMVSLKGINWFGFDSNDQSLHGLWTGRKIDSFLDQISGLGFNALRIPVSPESLSSSKVVDGFNTPLEELKALLAAAESRKIAILLDVHNCSIEAGHTSGSPEACKNYSKQSWHNDLKKLAELAKSYSYVVGIDLFNEPYKLTWEQWSTMAAESGKVVLNANPNILVFVEGVADLSAYGKEVPFWGENLFEGASKPVKLPKSRLVYSPHVYGPSVHNKHTYFKAANYPKNMAAIWDEHFGKLREQGYVLAIGEFGGKYTKYIDGSDKQWQDAFVSYLAQKRIKHFFYWSLNPNSGDTNGLLLDDWNTVDQDKLKLLKPIL